MLKSSPTVFAVESSYEITVRVTSEALVSVKVGEKTYFDETNGIMNSLSSLHKVRVPMAELDSVGKYTVCIRPITERLPYFTKTENVEEYSFEFRSVPEKGIRAYHIADAHNRIEEPVKAAKAFGRIDFLILNGDIIDHSGDPTKFDNIYEICSQITCGAVPVAFSRGNHDMRGNYAEKFAEYTPNSNGKTYYTFRLGSIWGIILDCGEDKDDSNPEYGFTVACHGFRERQTEFIRTVINNFETEYAAPDVKTRLVIVHNPFTERLQPPFDIECEIYREWALLLKKYVKPDLMICGHTHKCEINRPGCDKDTYGQPCTVVIASEPKDDRFIGCGFVIEQNNIKAVFTDNEGNTVFEEDI